MRLVTFTLHCLYKPDEEAACNEVLQTIHSLLPFHSKLRQILATLMTLLLNVQLVNSDNSKIGTLPTFLIPSLLAVLWGLSTAGGCLRGCPGPLLPTTFSGLHEKRPMLQCNFTQGQLTVGQCTAGCYYQFAKTNGHIRSASTPNSYVQLTRGG